MKKVIQWKEEENLSDSELGKRWGYSKSMISRMLTGERTPSPKKARQLVEISGGKLTLDDIYSTN